jgi:lipoprotein-anchoring transpeptidase ErfK/SrfK
MLKISRPLMWIAALGVAIVVITGSGGLLFLREQEGQKASREYQRKHELLDRELKAAEQKGYTPADLEPIHSKHPSLHTAQPPPPLVGDRPAFYRAQSDLASRLHLDLKAREEAVLNSAQDESAKQVLAAKSAVERSQQTGVDDLDLITLQQRLHLLTADQGASQRLPDYRAVAKRAVELGADAQKLITAQDLENQAIQQAAEELKVKTGQSLEEIRKVGQTATADARNQASVAAYLNKPSPFKSYAEVGRAASRLEKYAPMAGSGDLNQAAVAAAAAQRYDAQLHDLVVTGLPAKTIIISHSGQHLWALENGKVVQDTLITTGKPPNLATDMGPMKVLYKSSPWKMHSPWPKGSPFWYPDTVVQMVVWFTNTGEGLHDADWQPCCWGPGSQYGAYSSHGCVHVPFDSERFLFNWSETGTPVVVYPGDGSPVKDQLAQISTDDQGNPLTGPKGA